MVRIIFAAIFLFQLPVSAVAQIQVGSPSPLATQNALQNIPAQQREILERAIGQTQPIVIFLPGVLGSELKKGPDVIFGDVKGPWSKVDLAYKTSDAVDARLLEELKTPIIRPRSAIAYSTPMSFMKGITLAKGTNVIPFAYDWRQSNIKSSQEFSNFVCKHREAIVGKPLIFIAHSMGGIVLKYWLATEYHSGACGKQKLDQLIPAKMVQQIVFVGTPHLGAPKAFSALVDNYNIFADRESPAYAQILDRALAFHLNKHGRTFPSAYELLPHLAPGCPKVWQKSPIIMRVNNDDNSVDDIFLRDLWKSYDWPKGPYAENDTQATLEDNLEAILKGARKLACVLAEYKIDQEFKVIRFYGADVKSTDCGVVIVPGERLRDVTLEYTVCDGDGTVPAESANEFGKGRPLPGGHLELLSSRAFTSFLSSLFASSMRDLDMKYAEETNTSLGPVNFRAQLNQVIPPALETFTAAEREANDITIRTNNAVVQKIDEIKRRPPGTTASLVYEFADFKKSRKRVPALTRASAYEVAATLAETDVRRRSWALNNAASIALKQKDFSKAKSLALKALQEAEDVQRTHRQHLAEMRRLKGLAAWTVAIASKKLGHKDDVERYRRIAIRNGNVKASRVQM